MIDAKEFKQRFNIEPIQDDLKRINCDCAGGIGHFFCGVCETHDRPRWLCGCMKQKK